MRTETAPAPASPPGRLPEGLDRRFEAVIFDWDGTAVPDRTAPARRLRRIVEALSTLALDLAVVSGTNVGNVDGQLAARPTGPGRLYLALNRGSEVYAVGPAGPRLLERRTASPREEAALTAAAERTANLLAERGLETALVSARLNRRKIDLIPEPEWADPPKARITELLGAVEERLAARGLRGLPEVVEIARAAAHAAGLPDVRVTSDAKHVEIGLTDKSDSARWLLRALWRDGVGAENLLIVGDELGPLGGLPGSDSFLLVPEAAGASVVSVGAEPLGVPEDVVALSGGPDRFLALLEDQHRRRERRERPRVGGAPGWTYAVDGLDPALERVHESLLTLADGRVGTNGAPLLAHAAARPEVFAAGLYDRDEAEGTLLPCPLWNTLAGEVAPGTRLRRLLDLHAGLLSHELELRDGRSIGAVLFASLARPGTAVLRGQKPALIPAGIVPSAPAGVVAEQGALGGRHWIAVRAELGGAVTAVAEERLDVGLPQERLDRFAAYAIDTRSPPDPDVALRALASAQGAGFERLLREHRAAWGARWEDADIAVEGDPELQLAVRLALFHLMASVADDGDVAVGARGLSGSAYRGHVFWDADVYVLPFLAATHPQAARAMLEYRLRRLPAAQAAARAVGRAGARFPWESAASGRDVTPSHVHDRAGAVIPVRTGELEEHVVADIAWAAACYLDWTGDEAFAATGGRTLLTETARYWASRIRLDGDGRAHIYGVIGPDEYHEPVDDNAYTNVMARWNLRRAAQAVGDAVPGEERARWLALADALVDGYEAQTGVYEQFAGFHQLEPLVIEQLARRPIAADVLLGRARVAGAQVVKQADVLLLHHLVPDEVAPGSLERNLRFYEPRTAHGSSLSPGVHAALFARAGMLDDALAALRLASRIDVDDLTQTTAGGLHLAAMGSVWQAFVFGFAGARPAAAALALDPRLPPAWNALELRLRFRGNRVRLRIEEDSLSVQPERALEVRLPGGAPVTVGSRGARFRRRDTLWEEEAR